MKFHWQDGFMKDYPILFKICGLVHEGKRPSSVELTREELTMLQANPQYVLQVILPALTKKEL